MAKKKFDLGAYRATIEKTPMVEKPAKYLQLGPEMQAILGCPGYLMGDITMIYGDSDTGKSSLMLDAAARAQQQDIIPVLIITEKKYRESRAKKLGLDPENAIINLSCKTIEDVFEFADRIVADVNKGRLPKDVMIFVDSLGNINSKEARVENKDGTITIKNIHQKNAKIISENMRIFSDRIGETRYDTHNQYIGMVILNQMYEGTTPTGMVKHQFRGGKQLKFVATTQIKTSKFQDLKVTIDGTEYVYGIVSKIKVEKSHSGGLKQTGNICITEDKIFPNMKQFKDEYKTMNLEKWKAQNRKTEE